MLKKLSLIVVTIWLSGCHMLNSNVMFRPGPAYPYTNFTNAAASEYKIAPKDAITFSLYTNSGSKLIDIGLPSQTAGGRVESSYYVEVDGYAKLPLLRKTKIAGLTVRECESMLEEMYSKFYVDPFINVNVTNKRVTIFPGQGGSAKILSLKNDNTTLLEAIADVGGIPTGGKAHRIKLIRKNGEKYDVQLIDLSTLKNINDANIVLQANDIIYVQHSARIAQGIVTEITPLLTLLTTLLLSFTLYNQVNTKVN